MHGEPHIRFTPFVGRSKCPLALLTMLYFYYMENPGEFGFPNRVLLDKRTVPFTARTARTVTGKPCDQPGSYPSCDSVTHSFSTHDYATKQTRCLEQLQTSVWELPGSNPGRHTLQPTSRTWRNITLNYVTNINITWLVSGGIRHCGASFRILWLFRLSHSFVFFWFHFYHCIYGCMFCVFLYTFVNYVFLYVYVLLLSCVFRSVYCVSLCCSVYCLCANVYCTTAAGCQPNYSLQIYHIISYHIIYYIISYHIISYHITSHHIISYHIIYHISNHLPLCSPGPLERR